MTTYVCQTCGTPIPKDFGKLIPLYSYCENCEEMKTFASRRQYES